jgi:hypothetical protein
VLSTPGDDKEEEVQEISVLKLQDRESLVKSREACKRYSKWVERYRALICNVGNSSKIHGRKHIT